MLGSIVTAVACMAAVVLADCSCDFLENATGAYNAQAVSILSKNSTLSQAIKIDFNRSIHGTVQCATFTELIAATDPTPYVIHTRMVFDPLTEKASQIESIVTRPGDWLFNATGTLTLNASETWDPIPKAKQDSRAVIQAAGTPTSTALGGLPARPTLHGDDCEMVWPSTIHIPYRRYVVDEEMGAVDLFIGFPGLDRTQGDDPCLIVTSSGWRAARSSTSTPPRTASRLVVG